MHIEPGIVTGAKLALSYVTAAGALAYTAKTSFEMIKKEGLQALLGRSLFTTLLVFFFFQVLPHHPVGVSEVHFILGSTLFLMFGAAPAAIGLFSGLLLQGLLFAPIDLPQFGMNVTTLLVPLFAMAALARRTIPQGTAYVDISYKQALQLSLSYQGGIVAWVAFWALYGMGVEAHTLASVASFGAAYLAVVLLEPIIDLAVLAVAKQTNKAAKHSALLEARLFVNDK
ncbi:energy-coupling factor ABC transporter permease [Reinekea thalattae]|uniref:Cobalt transporter n=1 Tax=Reinekea thalattae TaxID=2593301 RepID=A0A5C8Z8H9_9GAMM|nr:energy-coupling factor ABC transporter permease [Reinekea thalattae]TXR53639.1 cobalt transporter [Reinekea thalattae]